MNVIDALKEYATRLREVGVVLPFHPPLHDHFDFPTYQTPSAASSPTLHSNSASPPTTHAKQAGDAIPLMGIKQQPRSMARKPVRTGTSRKRAKMDHSTSSSATNGRKNLGLLLTMPLDILFEVSCRDACCIVVLDFFTNNLPKILGHLPPKDILSVSRASKNFRETLMTRSATTVWKAARNRLDAPECPSWMSEPAWAALLFGHICQV
jgi:hypothetical protein